MKKLDRWQSVWQYLESPASAASYVGWTGHLNLGDEILLEAARECLEPLEVVANVTTNRPILRWIEQRKRHDIAILGGGTQIGNHPPFERFKAELAKAKMGLVFGAGVSEYVTQGPAPAWLERWGEVLRDLAYVGVRGPDSAATLARVGVDAEILGDPVCWFSQELDYWKPREKVFGLNVGQAHGLMFGDEATVHANFASYLKTMKQRGWDVEFFCVWPEDLPTTRQVAAEAGIEAPTIHCIYEEARPYLERVRSMKFFVGIKLHAVALAMAANVPSLMIEYRPKCLEFMNTMGMGGFDIRSDQMDLDRMMELTGMLDSGGPLVAESIRSAMLPIQRRLMGLRERIVDASQALSQAAPVV
jgi:polysaccharide pyruvyl transferase WcaK-like protein